MGTYKPGEYARLTRVIQMCNARIAHEQKVTAQIMRTEHARFVKEQGAKNRG